MKYPIGVQSFEKLREIGYVYVDKTAYIYHITHTRECCFLSRPRRFGKSLLTSTMEAYFLGKRHLFDGLAIAELETEWLEYPVIHLDLSNSTFDTPEKVTAFLQKEMDVQDNKYGLPHNREYGVDARFEDLIRYLYDTNGRRVVVLIDEYDKPMQDVIMDREKQKAYRSVLKPFYGTLKKMDYALKFVFITGVTKFAKLSLFSDLNQLKDISLMPEYDVICGITKQEMLHTFHEPIQEFAQKRKCDFDSMVEILEKNYDGYHFSERLDGVYNPFSLLNALDEMRIGSYWIQSGTPTLLANLLESQNTPLPELEGYVIDGTLLMSVESMDISPVPLIYQTGYLTIKGFDEASNQYILGYPNEEVKSGFLKFLLPLYSNIKRDRIPNEICNFVQEIRKGDAVAMLKRLQALFAGCNYSLILDREAHYQNVLYIVFSLIGLQVKVEPHISNGRMDLVIETSDYVYIMEFKYKGSAKKAMEQIHDNGYAIPYQCDPRKIILIAVNFNARSRNLDPRWLIEELPNLGE